MRCVILFLLASALTSVKSQIVSTITLNPLGPDDSYFISMDLKVGSNQIFPNIGLDQGSTPLWLPGSNCKLASGGPCSSHEYDPSKSTTYKARPDLGKFSIEYDDGTAFSGTYAQDTLNLPGLDIPNYIFATVNKASFTPDEAVYNQGVFGLAPKSKNDPGVSLPDMLYPILNQKVFTMSFPKSLAETGTMTIGWEGPPAVGVKLPISFADEAWNTPKVGVITASGEAIGKSFPAILDGGTDVIYVPKSVIKPWCKSVGWRLKKGDCIGPCSGVSKLPNFGFDFGNNLIVMLDMQNAMTYKYDGNTCGIAITSNPDSDGWTFGVAFIRQFHTVWNFTGLPQGIGEVVFS